jgi:hypothetical protein
MTAPRQSVHPPRLASWLIGMFASPQQEEAIDGDLLEEFSEIEVSRGKSVARRWYWKQSLKTSVQLFWTAVRSAPGLIAVTTVGAFFFLWATQSLPARLLIGVLDHYHGFFDAHFDGWLFCMHYGGLIVGWSVAILLGCLIGVVAKGKEIAATATFGLFRIVGAPIPTIALFWAYRALFPHHPMNWNTGYIGVVVTRGLDFAEGYRQGYGRIGLVVLYLIQPFSSVLPPILGGLIVRKIRSSSEQQRLLVSVN